MRTVNCSEQYYFFCQGIMQQPCPLNHFLYKGKCIYQSYTSADIFDAKHSCASRGGIVLPIKTKGMYYFVQTYSSQPSMNGFYNLLMGLNLTTNLYTDNTPYTSQSFDFDGQNVKFQGSPCVFLLEGIGYLPRGYDCTTQLQYFCLWTS